MAEATGARAGEARPAPARPPHLGRLQRTVLLGSVFLVASCGLGYELIGGAVSTYLLGDGVLQFSLTIGIFLSAMGVGSFLSRFVRRRLVRTFVVVEVMIGVAGAAVAPFLLWVYVQGGAYAPALVAILGLIGVLAGMEIPILLRIFQRHAELRLTASSVLGLDYIGALSASLAVPILLVPYVGTVGASGLFGLLNLAVAGLGIVTFPDAFPSRRGRLVGLVTIGALMVPMAGAVAGSGAIARVLEEDLYQDPVVYAEDTPYQRIVLTRWRGDLRLFLNSSLQFASRDEHRYHEGLVQPAMAAAARRARVLVLGGGDGLAVREILRWPDVRQVDLVDLDPAVTDLASTHADLVRLNEGSLTDPRVTVHNADAVRFLDETDLDPWDVVVMDLPDPSTPTLARLYARSSFRLVARHLAADGVLATQATSPFFSRAAFWCVADTLDGVPAGGRGGPPLRAHPYRVTVPSFGLWGFALATTRPLDPAALRIGVPTRHVTSEVLPSLFVFPPDEARPPGEACISRLHDPVLARTYRAGWALYGE